MALPDVHNEELLKRFKEDELGFTQKLLQLVGIDPEVSLSELDDCDILSMICDYLDHENIHELLDEVDSSVTWKALQNL